MRSKLSLSLVVAAALLLSACGTETITLSSYDGTETVTLEVEIADSPAEREEGLMNRTSLKPDSGMLFVFKESQMMAFWMKNTLIPLDIIFFDAKGEFVSAHTMEPCTENPCPTYESAGMAMYALEVRKDYRKDHGIGTGWKLDLEAVHKVVEPT